MAKLTVRQFFERFPSDDTCLDHLMDLRYGRVRECLNPKCAKPTEYYRLTKRPAYTCKLCGWHIYPCAGTPFENTRTPLQYWFYAIYLFTTTRHGVPAKELQRQLGVTYKTAWRMADKIREYIGKVDGDGDLSGHVEVDETYVGGKDNLPGRPTIERESKKTAVLGMVERGGEVITRVVSDVKGETLLPLITEHVKSGTFISSDQYRVYKKLRKLGYRHAAVNHMREWVRGDVHTNTLEGFWSHFKNSVRGTHRSISRQHMQKYLREFEFRFNHRKTSSSVMFDRLIQAF
ncbi:MAG TPA: IS1595 family transposase [Steroidobacteraceae bacterium]|nr:IS1595 family transposase [Steroidobacteraceae bacterium]